MSSSFDDFMRDMEEEARQAGPEAEAAFFESQQRHWVGRRLFERRRELGYTQAKLAALSGINQSDISKIEHAEANPNARHTGSAGDRARAHSGSRAGQ
jgi:DNA-binding XRE family transcriptional regulator